jgi:RNA polymerase sigma-70 factor (ECF subfamily)
MRWRVVPTRAKAQPAIGHYLLDDATGAYQPHTLSVLRLRGTRIADLVAFLRADMFGAFGLPAHP